MDISKITSVINNLSPRDQQKITNLVTKLANKSEQKIEQSETVEESSGKHDRSVRRPPATQVNKISEQGTPIQKIVNRAPPQKMVTHKSRATVGTVDTTIPIDAQNRPNLFIDKAAQLLGSQGLQGFKKDSKIDKLLIGENQLTPRGTRQEIVEAQCNSCGNVYEVSVKLITQDEDGIRFICDRCQKKGSK